MKKNLSEIVVKIVERNIQKEVDSVCLGFGFQPSMPDSARKFGKSKNK